MTELRRTFLKLGKGRLGRLEWAAIDDENSHVSAVVAGCCIGDSEAGGAEADKAPLILRSEFPLKDLAASFDEAFPSMAEVSRWLNDLQRMNIDVISDNGMIQLEASVPGVGIMRIPPRPQQFTRVYDHEAARIYNSVMLQLFDLAFPTCDSAQDKLQIADSDIRCRQSTSKGNEVDDQSASNPLVKVQSREGAGIAVSTSEGVRIKGRGRGRAMNHRHL